MNLKLTRRAFIQLAGAGSTGLLLTRVELASARASAPSRIFSGHQARTVLAAAEVIIPTRENEPSVVDVNVLDYIDREIRGSSERALFVEGLAGLDRLAGLLGRGPRRFADLPAAQRIAILKMVEAGTLPVDAWPSGSGPLFFRQLRRRIVEGYFSSPLVWKFIGYGGRSQFIGYPDFNRWPQQ